MHISKERRKTERSERRTAAWLRQEAEARGLRPGRKVRIEGIRIDGLGNKRHITRSGKVTGLYPYIFTCEIGSVTECFRYNQLIGNEVGERVKLDG